VSRFDGGEAAVAEVGAVRGKVGVVAASAAAAAAAVREVKSRALHGATVVEAAVTVASEEVEVLAELAEPALSAGEERERFRYRL
jgi:hypothetical protein